MLITTSHSFWWLLRLRPPLTGSLPKPDSQAKASGCCGLNCLNKDCPPPKAGCPLGDPGVSWKREKKIPEKNRSSGFCHPAYSFPAASEVKKTENVTVKVTNFVAS
jgi:hypothetical protein